MVNDLLNCFAVGFIAPGIFFFVLYVVRELKRYFLDTAEIKVD